MEMHIEQAFSLLQDQSSDTQTLQQSMTCLIKVFTNALQIKPKILKDFSRIVQQGRNKLGDGYLLVDVGPMYIVQVHDLNFTPVINEYAEKGSLDVTWMNKEYTTKFFMEQGMYIWRNLDSHIKSTIKNQYVLSAFLKFDRGKEFKENRMLLNYECLTLDLI